MQLRSVSPITKGLGLRELQAVLAVADRGSFRSAATALGYTQSALSHQVLALETALGLPVFDRPGGRAPIRLTPAGEAVCRRARRVLRETEAIAADARAAGQGEPALLRIGVTQTAAAEIMPGALRAFRRDYPAITVVLTSADDPAAAADALHRGDLDLAFSRDPRPDEVTEAVTLTEDRWVILTRRDSPLAESPRPAFDALHQTDMVAWTRSWQRQRDLEHAWQEHGIEPNIVYRTDDNLALQRLVAAGLGHACLGRLAASKAIDPALTWLFPREDASTWYIALRYPRHRPLSPATLALTAAIRAQTG